VYEIELTYAGFHHDGVETAVGRAADDLIQQHLHQAETHTTDPLEDTDANVEFNVINTIND